jgi:hypothetical protein
MWRTQLALDDYDTDKIPGRLLERYDPILQPWVDKPVKLLEIGIHKGGSLLLWRDYFPLGTIVGIDINPPKEFSPGERIRVFEGSQADRRFLSEVANTVAPEGFDIIIDDASHIAELTRTSFWHLFDNHLKPGGLYVIEDWGTGYFDDWPDGKSVPLKPAAQSGFQNVMSVMYQKYQRLRVFGVKHHLVPVPPTAHQAPPSPFLAHSLLAVSSLLSFLKTPSQCHSFGMVGFVKELVDEQGAADLTRRLLDNPPERQSRFESLLIMPSIVFVRKSEQTRLKS